MGIPPFSVARPTLEEAVAALARGEVIAHPTETVFGLAADPFNPEALERLLRLKGRAPDKGFILLVAGAGEAETGRLIEPPTPLARRLMERFWPGPLTLALPARAGLPPLLTGGRTHLALRHSSSPLVAALLSVWRGPLVSTSANPGGQPPPRHGDVVRRQWGAALSVVLDGVSDAAAVPSTIVRVEGDRADLLRVGAVTRRALLAAIPDLNLADGGETSPR